MRVRLPPRAPLACRLTPANSFTLLPTHDGLGPDKAGAVTLFWVAHAERVAVREILRDVAIVGQGNERTALAQMNVVPIIVPVEMREQACSRFFAAANNGEKHVIPPRRNTTTMVERRGRRKDADKSSLWNFEEKTRRPLPGGNAIICSLKMPREFGTPGGVWPAPIC